MMRRFFGIVLVAAVVWGAARFYMYYERVSKAGTEQFGWVEIKGENLSGLGASLGASYEAAKGDVTTLGRWLQQHANSPDLQDPRKAWIQLDYVGMLGLDDPAAAQRLFAQVKQRVETNSPVYPRIRQMEKTYE